MQSLIITISGKKDDAISQKDNFFNSQYIKKFRNYVQIYYLYIHKQIYKLFIKKIKKNKYIIYKMIISYKIFHKMRCNKLKD